MMFALHCRKLGCIFNVDTDDEREARCLKNFHQSRNAAINNPDRHHHVRITRLVAPSDPDYDILTAPMEVWAA